MKTTIDIPESELKDAMRFTGAKTKRAAVLAALTDFNRRRRMASLIRHSRSFTDFPPLKALRQTDESRDSLVRSR